MPERAEPRFASGLRMLAGVTDQTGLHGYALLTDPALELLRLIPSDAVTHSETYADAGTVSGWIFELENALSPPT